MILAGSRGMVFALRAAASGNRGIIAPGDGHFAGSRAPGPVQGIQDFFPPPLTFCWERQVVQGEPKPEVKPDSADTAALLDQVQQGDRQALDRLLTRHRPAFREFVAVHFDPKLSARGDPSDVVQEAQIEATKRMDDFLQRRPMPFHLWLRKTAYERLLQQRRASRRVKRSVEREVAWPERSSMLLIRPLLAKGPAPDDLPQQRELLERVGWAVAGLDEIDREVLPFAATMDPRHLKRFQNEARAAASLEHEHIVPVYGVGQERGVHFFAMKFIDGRTLAQVIAELRPSGQTSDKNPDRPDLYGATTVDQPGAKEPSVSEAAPAPPTVQDHRSSATLPEPVRQTAFFRRVAEWGIQAAEALEHAHSLGIVHRDIKPGNLMIDAQGKLWVTDFGLAQHRRLRHDHDRRPGGDASLHEPGAGAGQARPGRSSH